MTHYSSVNTTGPWHPTRDFWAGMRVAVTGATGFVGSHLTAELKALGAEVTILQRDSGFRSPVVNSWQHAVSTVYGSVEDLSLVERLLTEYEIEIVFHLAAQSQVGVANTNPLSTFESNVRGTWILLEAARRSPSVEAVVVASSDKAYGSHADLPYVEDAPLRAVHPYDVSKACGDLITASYSQCFSLAAAVARCGNIFGPGDLNWARLFPSVIRSVVRGERPVIRSDGTMVRDYLYVKDAALGYLRLSEALVSGQGIAGQAFNFSMEQPLSVLQIVDFVQEAAGTSLSPDIRSSASHEIPAQWLSSEKARLMLNWHPAYSLQQAVAETLEWYRSYISDEQSATAQD